MNAPIQHVVFDIGRVLIQWDCEIPYRHLINDETERKWFLENVCTPQWNLEQDRGRPWAEAEAELINQYREHENNIRAFRKHWIEMIPDEVPGTFAIMNSLIGNCVDVTLLTNFSQETFPEAVEKYPDLNNARGVTVSGEVQLLKPDLAIYEHHSRQFGLNGKQTLFFDDSPKNVEGARNAGWQAELFVSADQMSHDLKRYGVMV